MEAKCFMEISIVKIEPFRVTVGIRILAENNQEGGEEIVIEDLGVSTVEEGWNLCVSPLHHTPKEVHEEQPRT